MNNFVHQKCYKIKVHLSLRIDFDQNGTYYVVVIYFSYKWNSETN